MRPTKCLFLLALVVVFLLAEPATAARKARGVSADVPFILCETCRIIAKHSTTQINELRTHPTTKFSQLRALDMVEALCQPSGTAGRWARQIDLVERQGRLRVEEQDGLQDCGVECATAGMACAEVLEGVETELADRLYVLGKQGEVVVKDVEDWLCKEKSGISGACDVDAGELPKDRPEGPEFVPLDEKAMEMEKLMAQLQGNDGGTPNMDMFSREDLEKGMAGMQGGGDASADDDDEEEGDFDDDTKFDDDEDDDDDDETEEVVSREDGDSKLEEEGEGDEADMDDLPEIEAGQPGADANESLMDDTANVDLETGSRATAGEGGSDEL